MPQDPEGTSERIATLHELRVGVSDNPPWSSTASAQPAGIEADLVREFAGTLGTHVLWVRGSETVLVDALKHHELDVVIGGFEKKNNWVSNAGITQPYAKDADGKKHVLLAPPGENRFILSLDRFLVQHMRAGHGA